MQSKNPFLDEVSKFMTDAMGAARTAGEEARSMGRGAADKLISEMDLVRRDEFEAVKALAQEALAEVATLKDELARLRGEKSEPDEG